MADVKEESLVMNPHANLEETLYQLVKLYDSWSLEQRLVGKREAEMAKSVEVFNVEVAKLAELRTSHIKTIESLKAQIPKQVEEALTQTTEMSSKILSSEAKKLFEQEAFSGVKKILSVYRGYGFWVRWKTLLLLILSSAITGTLIGLYLIFQWGWPYGMYKKHYQFYYQQQEQQKSIDLKQAEIEKLKAELEAFKKAQETKTSEQKALEVEKIKKTEEKLRSIQNDTLWRR